MQEIKEEDEDTHKQNSNSQKSDAFPRYKPKVGYDPNMKAYKGGPVAELINHELVNNDSLGRRGIQTAVGASRPKRVKKAMNHEELISEINELKKSNRKDLEDIKKFKSEQLKIEK